MYDDKEAKAINIMNQLLEYLDYRLKSTTVNDNFLTTLMQIFENKIFTINKSSFVQYIPLFIMRDNQEKPFSKQFTERFLSFLIVKSFHKTGDSSKEHLVTR